MSMSTNLVGLAFGGLTAVQDGNHVMGQAVHSNIHPELVDSGNLLLYVQELLRQLINSFSVALEVRLGLIELGEGSIELRNPQRKSSGVLKLLECSWT